MDPITRIVFLLTSLIIYIICKKWNVIASQWRMIILMDPA